MYKVLIDELVFTEDFKKIDRPNQQRIIKAVRDKLSAEPRFEINYLLSPKHMESRWEEISKDFGDLELASTG
jgi:hypothetical protein